MASPTPTALEQLATKLSKHILDTIKQEFIPLVVSTYKLKQTEVEALFTSGKWVGARPPAEPIPTTPLFEAPQQPQEPHPHPQPPQPDSTDPHPHPPQQAPTEPTCYYLGERAPKKGIRCTAAIKSGFFCNPHSKTPQATIFYGNNNTHPTDLLIKLGLQSAPIITAPEPQSATSKVRKTSKTKVRLSPDVFGDGDMNRGDDTKTSEIPPPKSAPTSPSTRGSRAPTAVGDTETSDVQPQKSASTSPLATTNKAHPPFDAPTILMSDMISGIATTTTVQSPSPIVIAVDGPEEGNEVEVTEAEEPEDVTEEDSTEVATEETVEDVEEAITEETVEDTDVTTEETVEETATTEDPPIPDEEVSEDTPEEPVDETPVEPRPIKLSTVNKMLIESTTNYVFKKSRDGKSMYVIGLYESDDIQSLTPKDLVTLKSYGWEVMV